MIIIGIFLFLIKYCFIVELVEEKTFNDFILLYQNIVLKVRIYESRYFNCIIFTEVYKRRVRLVS